jgi:hypothetical protein
VGHGLDRARPSAPGGYNFGAPTELAQRWDGHKLVDQPDVEKTSGEEGEQMGADPTPAVFGLSANDVFLSSMPMILPAWSANPQMVHYDGAHFTTQSVPESFDANSLWASSDKDIWAVSLEDVVHYDGSTWSRVPVGKHTPYAVSGTGPKDVWIGEDAGAVAHFDGHAVTQMPAATDQDLSAIWAFSPDLAYAVGLNGTIVRWDGTRWSLQEGGLPESIQAMWGDADDDVWACGTSGLILDWDGHGWSEVASGTTTDLDSLWGSGPDDVWFVGSAGTVRHFDGHTVSRVANASSASLQVWGTGPDDVWMYGSQGRPALLHWNGHTLADMPIPGVDYGDVSNVSGKTNDVTVTVDISLPPDEDPGPPESETMHFDGHRLAVTGAPAWSPTPADTDASLPGLPAPPSFLQTWARHAPGTAGAPGKILDAWAFGAGEALVHYVP